MSFSLFNFICLLISILCVAVQSAHILAEDLEPKVQLKMPKVSAYLFERDDEFQEASSLKWSPKLGSVSPDLSSPRSDPSGRYSPVARLAFYNGQNEFLNPKPKSND